MLPFSPPPPRLCSPDDNHRIIQFCCIWPGGGSEFGTKPVDDSTNNFNYMCLT